MATVDVAKSDDVREGASLAVTADRTKLLLSRVEGAVVAVENRCPHLNLSMTRGKIEAGVIRCPWHGSTFDLCTGRSLDWITSVVGMKAPQWSRSLIAMGKQPTGLRTFPASEADGRVLVDL